MAFHEGNERLMSASRMPRELSGWLREIFLEDWTLKLLALAITLGLWYAVAGQRTPTTIRLRNVQLDFQLPNDMEISNDPRREIDVTITGSKRALESINMRDLVARVDVSDYKQGDRVVHLTPKLVAMDLPEGVRIDKIEPNTLPMRLEPSIEREVEVEARREGHPAEGYELYGINITPSKVRVRGPASHVNALQKAMTESIPLEGRKENFTIAQAAIDVPDQKITVIDPVVNVNVQIGEQRVEKSFAGVAVREATGSAQVRPETATVTLYATRSTLDALRPEDIQLILDVGADGSISTRLVLPQGMENRVTLRSTKPSGFSIIR
jgi:YbbR domain-containing protein